jgi:hypothetical protein
MAGTIVANTINTDTGLFSTNNAYLGVAKAWVNFDGYTGSTATIKNSFNVSSVTYVSTGTYTVTFTTAMPNANYVPTGMLVSYNTGESGFVLTVGGQYDTGPTSMTTTQCRFETGLSRGTSLLNNIGIYIAILGS